MAVSVYDQINEIIEALQAEKWNAHSLAMLVASQGKLAALLGNVNEDQAKARQEYDTTELNTKMKEADRYLIYRKEGRTEAESKAMARLDTKDEWNTALDKKGSYMAILGLRETMITLITACQVTIKNLGKERDGARYVEQA